MTRSCLERAGLTSTKETNTNRSTAVDGSCKSTNVKQIGHFHSHSTGQTVAWTEPVVFILIDVRRAHSCSPARRKVFVELPEEGRH